MGLSLMYSVLIFILVSFVAFRGNYPISFYYNHFSQKSAFKKKYCDLSFYPNFKMLILKSLEKQVVFKKNIIKNIKLGLKGPKMIEKCEFYPNFAFSMNFRPLNPHYFFFCDVSFHQIFKMLILKSLEKKICFQKKIIKNSKCGLKGPKMIKKF